MAGSVVLRPAPRLASGVRRRSVESGRCRAGAPTPAAQPHLRQWMQPARPTAPPGPMSGSGTDCGQSGRGNLQRLAFLCVGSSGNGAVAAGTRGSRESSPLPRARRFVSGTATVMVQNPRFRKRGKGFKICILGRVEEYSQARVQAAVRSLARGEHRPPVRAAGVARWRIWMGPRCDCAP